MAEWSIAALRTILSTETDAGSDLNEELLSQIRENIEALIMLMFYTGDDGSLTADPPDSTVGTITDSAGGYDVDEHNGRVVIITSGTAEGNIYQIDDTTATTLVCTGDNLYSDGVRSGDTYKVFHDLKNTHAHAHDGIDSAIVELADNQVTAAKIIAGAVGQSEVADSAIGYGELKSAAGGVNTSSGSATNLTLPGGNFGFYPTIATQYGTNYVTATIANNITHQTTYVLNISLHCSSGSGEVYAYQYYVTASGDRHWIYILLDEHGKQCAAWESPDHVCFGNGGKPLLVQHPFNDVFEESGKLYAFEKDSHGRKTDNKLKREIIVINPTLAQVEKIIKNQVVHDETKPDLNFWDALDNLYSIDELITPQWNDEPVNVGLPRLDEFGNIAGDYRFKVGQKVQPVKKQIPKPIFMNVAQLKVKA